MIKLARAQKTMKKLDNELKQTELKLMHKKKRIA